MLDGIKITYIGIFCMSHHWVKLENQIQHNVFNKVKFVQVFFF